MNEGEKGGECEVHCERLQFRVCLFFDKGGTYYLERKSKHCLFKILFLVPLALGAVENR